MSTKSSETHNVKNVRKAWLTFILETSSPRQIFSDNFLNPVSLFSMQKLRRQIYKKQTLKSSPAVTSCLMKKQISCMFQKVGFIQPKFLLCRFENGAVLHLRKPKSLTSEIDNKTKYPEKRLISITKNHFFLFTMSTNM
jgi:hypothetical protein